MAFDQPTRNRLARFVSETRSLLVEEFTRQLQNDYGLDPNSGDVTDLARLDHLDDARHETARLLRDTKEHHLASADISTPAKTKKACQDVLGRIVREQAFTILNRLCALRMAEARGLLIESIAKGYQSKGFQLYQRLAGTALGETGDCYRLFLFSVFDEFAVDLPLLFDRSSPQGRLFPREAALVNVLQEINHADIAPLWAEDETIGWIYQYFNSVEERRQMRAESQAPRNSRELAIRNQFFTPRYVVEFLTDNTLGRVWYEMTKGEAALKDYCRYLVRRPNEIFLTEGEKAPEQGGASEELSQEQLLKQPVHILHRPLKDPRDIKMLDPACGSMHFGLYAFDLFERIYEEAWEIEAQRGVNDFVRTEGLKSLHESYADKTAFLRDVPRLIIERNIHGIDIDPRAVQIAGLSLWLRAQRSWQVQNVKALDRPQIHRSNIVCAEPMPGEADMLEEFSDQLRPKLLGQLVKIIFEKMKLAGEAGSLLKIEEEIKEAISAARAAYGKFLLDQKKDSEYLPGMAPERGKTLFDFADLPKVEDFWNHAENLVFGILADYVGHPPGTEFTRRRMFARDAVGGFAFIDICRKGYDAVVMNPPFGSSSVSSASYIKSQYADASSDLYACFVMRAVKLTHAETGLIGAITNRTGFFIDQLSEWRDSLLPQIEVFADLGSGVLDALVEAAVYIISMKELSPAASHFGFDLLSQSRKDEMLLDSVCSIRDGKFNNLSYVWSPKVLCSIPGAPLAYWATPGLLRPFRRQLSLQGAGFEAQIGVSTKDDFRFLRLRWETPPNQFKSKWFPLAKGGEYSRYWSDLYLMINFESSAKELHAFLSHKYPYLKGNTSWVIHAESGYYRPALTYTRRTSSPLSVRILPEDCVFSDMGRGVVHESDDKCELFTLLGLMNTRVFRYFVELCVAAGDEAARTYEGGILNQMPVLSLNERIKQIVKRIASNKKKSVSLEETTAFFVSPFCDFDGELIVKDLIASQKEIEDICAEELRLSEEDVNEIKTRIPESNHIEVLHFAEGRNKYEIFLSYCFGASFCRWDIRFATGARTPVEPCDPFASLPICPPGMLQNTSGLPIDPEKIPKDYPLLPFSFSGIQVDDESNIDDIISNLRRAIELIQKEQAETYEQEILKSLNQATLRDYFACPSGFFATHLSAYSKSRRYAPIYWPLSTPSCSFTIWLYYHRLTDQTLYSCVNDFIDPKLKQVSDDASSLGGKSNRSSVEEIELERMLVLEQELKDFREELLRIARFWKPNLNDGVQITAAPLWNLFQHRGWKARLKDTWEKLEVGEYDWAHLALSIWPDRVIRASHKDRSYAIAHDLEDELWHEVEVEKVGRGGRVTTTTEWQPRDLSNEDLQRIIAKVKARCHQG
jgi:hypothetical protein